MNYLFSLLHLNYNSIESRPDKSRKDNLNRKRKYGNFFESLNEIIPYKTSMIVERYILRSVQVPRLYYSCRGKYFKGLNRQYCVWLLDWNSACGGNVCCARSYRPINARRMVRSIIRTRVWKRCKRARIEFMIYYKYRKLSYSETFVYF